MNGARSVQLLHSEVYTLPVSTFAAHTAERNFMNELSICMQHSELDFDFLRTDEPPRE